MKNFTTKNIALFVGKLRHNAVLIMAFAVTFCSTARAQYQWEPLPITLNNLINPSNGTTVKGLYVDPVDTSLWIMGDFWHANGHYCPGVAVLNRDGTQRVLPAAHTPSNTDGLSNGWTACRYNGKVYVGGEGGLYAWNGNSWTVMDTLASVTSMSIYQGKLLIGGTFINSPLSSISHILMEWDGSTMQPFRGIDSIAHLQNVMAMIEYKGDLIVAGNIIPTTATGTGPMQDIYADGRGARGSRWGLATGPVV